MTEAARPRFPSKDADGRIDSLVEFLATALLATVLCFAMLAAIDGLFTLIGSGSFGRVNGWMAIVLSAFVFLDDFKAWAGTRFRVPVFLAAVLLALVTGLGVNAAMPDTWVPLLSGGLAAVMTAVVYVILWFTGIRMLGRED